VNFRTGFKISGISGQRSGLNLKILGGSEGATGRNVPRTSPLVWSETFLNNAKICQLLISKSLNCSHNVVCPISTPIKCTKFDFGSTGWGRAQNCTRIAYTCAPLSPRAAVGTLQVLAYCYLHAVALTQDNYNNVIIRRLTVELEWNDIRTPSN